MLDDQETILLPCSCNGPHHVKISYFPIGKQDTGPNAFLSIEGCFGRCTVSFWQRLAAAWRVLWNHHWCWAETLLTRETVVSIKEFIERHEKDFVE